VAAASDNLGVRCDANGLFLAGAALVERRDAGYRVRAAADLEHLLRCAYNGKITVSEIEPGLQRAASPLTANRTWLARSEAERLPLPALPNPIAALRLEIADLRIAAEPLRKALLRAGWDPAQHPRVGVPPNPGWFAPTDGSAGYRPISGSEEEERPEETLDTLAEVRERAWQSAVAKLREIDPANPELQSLYGPDWVPSQADLDTLNGTIREAEIGRVMDKLMPNGEPIGTAGNSTQVRELPGGLDAAQNLWAYLRVGGTVSDSAPGLTVVRLPGNAGYVTWRPVSTSGPPAIDINIPGSFFMKIHFP
jgi:hypothetical protein